MPLSQLAIDGMQNPHQCFSEEQEIPLKVIEFDENQKKIVLSVRDYFRDKDQTEYEAYLEAHPIGDYTVDEETADSDDEMESWGDAHEEGGAPAEEDGEES